MYLSLSDLVLIFAAMALVLYAWHAIGLKQKALRAVDHYCKQLDLQLLDQSLVLVSLKPLLTSQGPAFKRRYRFEFSATGDRRHQGTIELTGSRIQKIHLDPYPVIES